MRLLTLAALLPALTLTAQQGQPVPSSSTFVLAHRLSSSCPAAFSATRSGTLELKQASDPHAPEPPTLKLHALTRSSEIAGLTVLARGPRPGGQLELTAGNGTRDALERLTLDQPTLERAAWQVQSHHLAAIRALDILEVRFLDGTSWHAPNNRACEVQPSLLMRVAN